MGFNAAAYSGHSFRRGALNAASATVEEGILPGGDDALLKTSIIALDNLKPENFNQQLGVTNIHNAFTRPTLTIVTLARTLARRAALSLVALLRSIAINLSGVMMLASPNVNVVERGIVDPLKVVGTALIHASGVASLYTS
ncbi:hypothetical protein M422DRAFT_42798 [Sphaerobolus stellatus SS14]|nr:hypothetical protein M422DRAFT_42798 [Sphaerobolus stellatus SS14]